MEIRSKVEWIKDNTFRIDLEDIRTKYHSAIDDTNRLPTICVIELPESAIFGMKVKWEGR